MDTFDNDRNDTLASFNETFPLPGRGLNRTRIMIARVCYFALEQQRRWLDNGTTPLFCKRGALGGFFNGPLSTTVISIGFLTNCWCLLVFTRPHKPPRIYQYLVALALWDNALLLGAFLLYSLPTLYYGCNPGYGFYVYFYPYWYCLGNITLVGCVWVIVALAFDRSFALYRPLLHKAFQSRKRTRLLLGFISLGAFLYGLPRFFEMEAKLCPLDPSAPHLPQIPYMDVTKFRSNDAYTKLYKIFGGLLLYSFVPFLILLVLTLLLLAHLKKARRTLLYLSATYRKAASAPCLTTSNNTNSEIAPNGALLFEPIGSTKTKKRQTRGGSALLAIISAKFLLARLLPVALDLTENIFGLKNLPRFMVGLVTVSNFLVILNSATNILVYLFTGQQFRRQSLTILRTFFCSPRRPWTALRRKDSLSTNSTFLRYDVSDLCNSTTSFRNSPICRSPNYTKNGEHDVSLNKSFIYLKLPSNSPALRKYYLKDGDVSL